MFRTSIGLVSQHRISKFPIMLTKITLEHNEVTLKIEPTRFCEVFAWFRQVSSLNRSNLLSGPRSKTGNNKPPGGLRPDYFPPDPLDLHIIQFSQSPGPTRFRSWYYSEPIRSGWFLNSSTLFRFGFASVGPSEGSPLGYLSGRPTTPSADYSG